MTGVALIANHSTGHWALDFLLFMTPAIVLAVVLFVWQRRDRAKKAQGEDRPPEAP